MQEFSRRLYRLMRQKRWSQSDLARASGVSRDGISGYVRGLHMPTHDKVSALAAAFEITEDELLPNLTIDAIKDDPISISFKASSSDETRGWLRLNRLVTMEAATQVMAILTADSGKATGGKKAAGGKSK